MQQHLFRLLILHTIITFNEYNMKKNSNHNLPIADLSIVAY